MYQRCSKQERELIFSLFSTLIIITEAITAEIYIVHKLCAERADSPCRLYKHSPVVSVIYFFNI